LTTCEPPTDVIRRYKQNTDPALSVSLPIVDAEAKDLGSLLCVDRAVAADPAIVADFTDWRAHNMSCFLTQFSATPARTAKWLETVVLPSNERILFLICRETGERIGNMGVCNLGLSQGEIDNVIRGRKGGSPGLIFHAELALLAWMFGSLSLQTANLHVFSNNSRAIHLYASVGFTACRSHRLSRVAERNEVHYLLDSAEGEMVDFRYDEMSLTKDAFFCRHPWTARAYAHL
jgi:RimJ/RimL family protein N-acetyltransferase